MNIEQAKAIAVAQILAKIEFEPVKEDETDATFYSPFRNERTPSFHVNKQANVWFDHGEGIGGNAFELVIQILKFSGHSFEPADALRWLRNTNLDPSLPTSRDLVKGKKSKWSVLDVTEVKNFALLMYLEKRGINTDIAGRFLKELYIKGTTSPLKVYGLGFKNEDGGYEFRNRFFKTCIAPKTISFVRADDPKPAGVMIFEGFMDFLTYATIKSGKLSHDVIVLNSVACVDHAIRYIKNYGYEFAYSWMDNDKAGEKAKQRLNEFLKSEGGLLHRPLNHLYDGHKDLNAWHMYNLNLK